MIKHIAKCKKVHKLYFFSIELLSFGIISSIFIFHWVEEGPWEGDAIFIPDYSRSVNSIASSILCVVFNIILTVL
jgi:hypothetical protein